MKLIDKYILKKFLSSFFFVVLVLVAVILVIDITEKNDDFIKHNLGFKEILGYYSTFIPYISNLITPITVFIATVFVTAKMAGHTEIIAILSSGISFRRLMVPYLIGSVLIALISFVLTGWVIPETSKKRVAFEVQYLKRPYYFDERNVHIQVGKNSFLYMESYNNQSSSGYKFTLETIKDNKLLAKLSADRIEWIPDKKKWTVQNWTRREFNGMKESVISGEKMDTMLRIHPKDFESNFNLHETMSIGQLDRYIKELNERGAANVEVYQIEKYIRYMSPFAILILTFIGLIVSARKSRGGAGFQIALGFFIAFIFIIFFIMSRAIAESAALNPIIAVWIPNIIFSIVGIVLYKTVPR